MVPAVSGISTSWTRLNVLDLRLNGCIEHTTSAECETELEGGGYRGDVAILVQQLAILGGQNTATTGQRRARRSQGLLIGYLGMVEQAESRSGDSAVLGKPTQRPHARPIVGTGA
jgi:hypothetical protein